MPNPPLPSCPLCGQRDVVPAGQVVHAPTPRVAGVPIELDGIKFQLRRCRSCQFQFKDPPVPQDRLADCYARSAADHWGENLDPRRRRFDLLAELLRQHAPGNRILDVGCSNGEFLASLGSTWNRFGIEPGKQASARAAQRGITMLGGSVEDLTKSEHTFDAISAIDVLEHTPDPGAFLVPLVQKLSPGGVLLLLTGDTQSWPWRLLGGAYWYCGMVEHVSFFSRPAIAQLAGRFGLNVVECLRAAHEARSIFPRANQWRRTLEYFVKSSARRLFGRPLKKHSPICPALKDHLFCLLKKPCL